MEVVSAIFGTQFNEAFTRCAKAMAKSAVNRVLKKPAGPPSNQVEHDVMKRPARRSGKSGKSGWSTWKQTKVALVAAAAAAKLYDEHLERVLV